MVFLTKISYLKNIIFNKDIEFEGFSLIDWSLGEVERLKLLG